VFSAAPRLVADARKLVAALADDARVVLLGSVATAKYLDVLASIFQSRLHFPSAFIGRGDMSRGGLMLRSASSGEELEYIALSAAATAQEQIRIVMVTHGQAASGFWSANSIWLGDP